MLAVSFGASIRSLQYQQQQELPRSIFANEKNRLAGIENIEESGEDLFANTINIVYELVFNRRIVMTMERKGSSEANNGWRRSSRLKDRK
uniref:Uncharacterized protein n=1 Tax=Caenorhabditis japonica TaxID=281687 RepID=A0A8R1J295_CAEJA